MAIPHPARCLFALTLLLAAAAHPATVYRCRGPDGTTAFSQFPCSDARGREGSAFPAESVQTIDVTPISEAERQRLDALARERRERLTRQQAARRRHAEAVQARRAEDRSRCLAARHAQEALARQRRKGYSLREARALDRRESELDAEQRRYC